jgi:putative transcriptional regulator
VPDLTGKLLVASPHLTDRNFFRTVILILRHEPSDAFGLVLNRPTGCPLSEMLENPSDTPIQDGLGLHWGGPVEGPLMALHRESDLGEMPCGDEVYGTMDERHLLSLIRRPDSACKFFAGYSGWGPGQLDSELEAGGWLVAELDEDDVFGETSELWETVVQRVGRSIMQTLVPLHGDFDVSVN